MPMDLYTASLLALVAAVVAAIYVDRENIECAMGVMLIRRTRRGREFIDSLVGRSPRFWNFMGDLGIVSGGVGLVAGVYYLIQRGVEMSAGTAEGGGLKLIAPVPPGSCPANFLLCIDPWFFIIVVLTLVLIHEGFHAIQVRGEGVDIESMGLALFAVIPGAFVEPDEEELEKRSWRSQMRVYAAGSLGNFVLGGSVFLLLFFIVAPIFTTGAVAFDGYVDPAQFGETEPFPAQKAGINTTDVITELDGQRVTKPGDLASILRNRTPGERIEIKTMDKETHEVSRYQIRLARHPEDEEMPFIGIGGVREHQILREEYRRRPRQAGVLNFTLDLLFWMIVINVGVGIFNLLPLKPLDGGLMAEVTLKELFPENHGDIMRVLSAFTLVLVLWGLFGGMVI